jgi:hypothetical protein
MQCKNSTGKCAGAMVIGLFDQCTSCLIEQCCCPKSVSPKAFARIAWTQPCSAPGGACTRGIMHKGQMKGQIRQHAYSTDTDWSPLMTNPPKGSFETDQAVRSWMKVKEEHAMQATAGDWNVSAPTYNRTHRLFTIRSTLAWPLGRTMPCELNTLWMCDRVMASGSSLLLEGGHCARPLSTASASGGVCVRHCSTLFMKQVLPRFCRPAPCVRRCGCVGVDRSVCGKCS